MENNKVIEIMELDRKIEDIVLKTTSYYSPNETQELNNYDSKVMEFYQRILDLIIKIAKDENTKDIATIDEKYFIVENTASMMIESYISTLQFYGNIDRRITKKEIQVISQIQENLTLDDNFEMKNKIELADCYFHIGDEKKARELMLDFIKNNPDEDEPYMCMQNWYMYYALDINKLGEVIDLAEKNKHILVTDFGYDRLVKFYDSIGDNENKKKYQQLYDKWKKNIEL